MLLQLGEVDDLVHRLRIADNVQFVPLKIDGAPSLASATNASRMVQRLATKARSRNALTYHGLVGSASASAALFVILRQRISP
jgi:hypothetical protein